MDPAWANSNDGKKAGYQELKTKPKNLIPHPTEPDFVVNAYFYRLNSEETLQHLQRKFGSEYHQQKHPSVGTLLAAFFHYYAYEFDYKHHVVSLNATMAHGKVEREVKAEHDTWKVYGQGLSIEDPFETFYDVAHVVKASNFHRIRREFALAYTKMVDAATGNNHHWSHMPQNIGPTMSGSEILDWICEPLPKDTDDSNTS
jgi:DNA polymerase sigma